jgi:hypothetical protein
MPVGTSVTACLMPVWRPPGMRSRVALLCFVAGGLGFTVVIPSRWVREGLGSLNRMPPTVGMTVHLHGRRCPGAVRLHQAVPHTRR